MGDSLDYVKMATEHPDILLRYIDIWKRMPRHRQNEQGFKDLLFCLRDELGADSTEPRIQASGGEDGR
jgi:hypothetical protein